MISTARMQPFTTILRKLTRMDHEKTPYSSLNAVIPLNSIDVPHPYRQATILYNIVIWAPGIKRGEGCISENNTFSLVVRKKGMHVIPCIHVFKVDNGTPKS